MFTLVATTSALIAAAAAISLIGIAVAERLTVRVGRCDVTGAPLTGRDADILASARARAYLANDAQR